MSITFCYILIIAGILVWGVFLFTKKKVSQTFLDMTTTFGGAFLFAACFLQLVPHVFVPHIHGEIAGHAHEEIELLHHLKPGIWILVGFLIQLFLEFLTNGIEHGHNHAHCCEEHDANHVHPVTGLLIGLSLHAFMEGMPITFGEDEIHWGLLYGIFLHNIPISLVLITLFMNNRYSTAKSFGLLTVFAVMTPLGSLVNRYLISGLGNFEVPIMGIVVGILLHVSVSILFDHGDNKYSKLKILLILMAFALAYLVPGCQH